LSHVRLLFCGAAPLSAALTEKITRLLPNADVGQGYGLFSGPQTIPFEVEFSSGMTETCTSISMAPSSQRIGTLGSAGQLIPGVRGRVVKEDGTLAKAGEPGELVVNTPSLALGYLDNKKA
jgi:4-coumarate--CoA ligase